MFTYFNQIRIIFFILVHVFYLPHCTQICPLSTLTLYHTRWGACAATLGARGHWRRTFAEAAPAHGMLRCSLVQLFALPWKSVCGAADLALGHQLQGFAVPQAAREAEAAATRVAAQGMKRSCVRALCVVARAHTWGAMPRRTFSISDLVSRIVFHAPPLDFSPFQISLEG